MPRQIMQMFSDARTRGGINIGAGVALVAAPSACGWCRVRRSLVKRDLVWRRPVYGGFTVSLLFPGRVGRGPYYRHIGALQ